MGRDECPGWIRRIRAIRKAIEVRDTLPRRRHLPVGLPDSQRFAAIRKMDRMRRVVVTGCSETKRDEHVRSIRRSRTIRRP